MSETSQDGSVGCDMARGQVPNAEGPSRYEYFD